MSSSVWPWCRKTFGGRRRPSALRSLRWDGLRPEYLEDRTLLDGNTLATASLLAFHPVSIAPAPLLDESQINGSMTAGQTDWYQLVITQSEQFTVNAGAAVGSTLVPRLMLDGSNGQQLVQSDGGSIIQHLQPDTYYVTVSAVSGSGGYQLIADLAPALSPLRPLAVGQNITDVAIVDVNGDGKPDLVVADGYNDTVSVLLGNGDGTFQPPTTSYPVGDQPVAVAVAKLTDDGNYDIITANGADDKVSILLGNGDGTFQQVQDFPAGIGPDSVAVADLNGDGKPDLVVTNYGTRNTPGDTVTVLVNGTPNGTTRLAFAKQTFADGNKPSAVAVADLSGDGKLDLVTADYNDGTVSVLRNETPMGAASVDFAQRQTFPVGSNPEDVVVADLNGDGKPDLAVANGGAQTVSVLLNQTSPNATAFAFSTQTFTVGAGPDYITVGDLNGDGKPDIVAANYLRGGSTVSVLLNQTVNGNAVANFAPQQVFNVGGDPRTVSLGDLNGNGKLDLVTANANSGTISVLAGNGDGSFQTQPAFGVGADPLALVAADLNGDGHPDLVTANGATNTVSVLLGNGDGTFQTQQTLPVGDKPDALAVADLNNDGRADLVVANENDGTLNVLLGNGDGTFSQPRPPYPAGQGPDAVTVADLNGDGIPDLIVANGPTQSASGHTISILLGNGDGTFQPAQTFDVGTDPVSVAVADLTGDGKPDIVTANYRDGTVSVLRNDTTPGSRIVRLTPLPDVQVDEGPQAVTVADVYGDGIPDLVVANYYSGTVSVVEGKGDGTFFPEQSIQVGASPVAVKVADLTDQKIPDIITANFGDGTVSVLLGDGKGLFPSLETYPAGMVPTALAVTDVNGDGNLDLVVANGLANTASVLLGDGSGDFTPPLTTAGIGYRNTPFLVNPDGKSGPESVILDSSGDVLLRTGLPGTDNPLVPPVIVNPDRPARDLAVVSLGSGGWAVATADANFDATLSSPGHLVYTVSLYMISPDGTVSPPRIAFRTDVLPTRIIAADLTGTGLPEDLVVANELDNSVIVALQTTAGHFTASARLPVGDAPDDITVVRSPGSPYPDIAVSDGTSGDVTILLNDPAHTFATSERFRADTGLYALDPSSSSPAVVSLASPVSLAAGDFTGFGADDLAVVNRGANTVAVLLNDGNRGFTDPATAFTAGTNSTSVSAGLPGPVVVGYFHGAGQPLDLAVLMENLAEVWVYSGDGAGHFTHTFTVAAGSAPTGLCVIDDPVTGFSDLVVGNPFGDILRLVGDGQGHFQPPPVSGPRTALDVLSLPGGQSLALVANQASNTVSLQAPVPGGVQFATVQNLAAAPSAQLAPGAVSWAKLEGSSSPFDDAVVVASGSNSVLVYRGIRFNAQGHPIFASPVSYSVGTDPVAVNIQDINGDGIPDLVVANHGSNDVSIIFGSLDAAGDWVGQAGPRLQSGGQGPVATTLRELDGNDVLDLIVTNENGTMTVLPGRGQGFFDDRSPTILNIPGNPELMAPSFFGTSDEGVVATADGRLIGFDLQNFIASVHVLFTPPPGEGVDSFEALSDGNVIAALAGGTVVELTPQAGALAIDRFFAPMSGIPSDPSALAVLQGESGIQVLVLDASGDRVFVFGIPGLSQSPPLPPSEASSVPVIEATPPTESPLTLVLTTTFGGVADRTAVDSIPPIAELLSEPSANPGAAFIAIADATLPVPEPVAQVVVAGELIAQDESLPERLVPAVVPSGIDEAEKLRSIDLYEPPENPDPTVPASGIPAPAGSTVPIPPLEEVGPDRPISSDEMTGETTGDNSETLPCDQAAVDEVFQRETLWNLGTSGLLAIASAGMGQFLEVAEAVIASRQVKQIFRNRFIS